MKSASPHLYKRYMSIKTRSANGESTSCSKNTAWHTAYIHTVVPESGDKQGRVGYAKYAGRYSCKIQPGSEVYIICQAPPNPSGLPYTAVVEDLPQNASLIIAHIVTDIVKDRRVPVRICNISAKPIIVPGTAS